MEEKQVRTYTHAHQKLRREKRCGTSSPRPVLLTRTPFSKFYFYSSGQVRVPLPCPCLAEPQSANRLVSFGSHLIDSRYGIRFVTLRHTQVIEFTQPTYDIRTRTKGRPISIRFFLNPSTLLALSVSKKVDAHNGPDRTTDPTGSSDAIVHPAYVTSRG